MIEYITFIEVLTIHKILIDKYGGSHGLRDAGALEAALFRPQTGYYTGSRCFMGKFISKPPVY